MARTGAHWAHNADKSSARDAKVHVRQREARLQDNSLVVLRRKRVRPLPAPARPSAAPTTAAACLAAGLFCVRGDPFPLERRSPGTHSQGLPTFHHSLVGGQDYGVRELVQAQDRCDAFGRHQCLQPAGG